MFFSKKKKFMFLPHRGCLSDSLRDRKVFDTFESMSYWLTKEFFPKEYASFFAGPTLYIESNSVYDKRIDGLRHAVHLFDRNTKEFMQIGTCCEGFNEKLIARWTRPGAEDEAYLNLQKIARLFAQPQNPLDTYASILKPSPKEP